MIKFINRLVVAADKLKNFFYFFQALQVGIKAFTEEWTKLTGQDISKIEESLKDKETE